MKILIVSSGFLPAEMHGGVPFSAYNLAVALINFGNDVKVFSTNQNGTKRLNVFTNQWTQYEGIDVYYAKVLGTPYTILNFPSKDLKDAISNSDIVIDSSTLWNHLGYLCCKHCLRFSKPHVVYPRGLLDPWALNNKYFRKLLVMMVQGRKILRTCSAVVALSQKEKESIIKYVRYSKIHVLPNGAPKLQLTDGFIVPPEILLRNLGDDIKYILFMGRVSKKKGLEQSVRAFQISQVHNPRHYFFIVGPVDEAYKKEFVHLMQGTNNIFYIPPKLGAEKAWLINNSSALILTSFSEGMPMVVLEALGAGIPVIVTPECNIPEITSYNAGWQVDIGSVEHTAEAIDMAFDSDENSLKSKNAKILIQDCFDWNRIAENTDKLLRTFLIEK